VLKQLRTGQTFERVTNADGIYTAPLLPIGEYEITFSLAGFQTRVVRGIPLSVNDRVVADARLAVGGVSEVVEVTTRSLMQLTAASITACNVAGDRFGQLLATRAPREIQLGLKLYW
jgi:hypothetical protein